MSLPLFQVSRGLFEGVRSKIDLPRDTRLSIPYLILSRIIKYLIEGLLDWHLTFANEKTGRQRGCEVLSGLTAGHHPSGT